MRIIKITVLWLLFGVLAAMPPHPKKHDWNGYTPAGYSHRYGPAARSRALPQHVLALRAQFSDVQFSSAPSGADSLAHDDAYFNRCMFHLSTYWSDMSDGNYRFDYTLAPVVTLPHPMSWYGDDNHSSQRVAQLARDAVTAADSLVDYSLYDAVVLFHAGAGQEADIYGKNTGEVWSTFLTIADLRDAFDPNNDDYPGLASQEGYITEMSIYPESEWQPDFTVGTDSTLGILGVLCHQFGHQLGLPTLFDNYIYDGQSGGVGNFSVMGTGAWNGNGFVPPPPDPWCRAFLGWVTPVTISSSQNALKVMGGYPRDFSSTYPVLYKLPINDKEYYLVENYCQNPDNSDYHGVPSFTFTLLPNGQDYYPEPYSDLARFNFMENSYRGCEWYYYGPGLGGPDMDQYGNPKYDGSGLLIWHIDENVIAENLSADLEYNSVNHYALHKGIDVVEASGVQYMDSYTTNYYSGSPFTTFRSSADGFSNTYFGRDHLSVYNEQTGEWEEQIHLPAALSYYGGMPLEISGISEAGRVMSFNVKYPDQLVGGEDHYNLPFSGACPWPPLVADMDNDGNPEQIYIMPDGLTYAWKNGQTWIDLNGMIDPPCGIWSYDNLTRTMLVPANANGTYNINWLSASNGLGTLPLTGHDFCGPVVIQSDYSQDQARFYALQNNGDDAVLTIGSLSADNYPQLVSAQNYTGLNFCGNAALYGTKLYVPVKSAGAYRLLCYQTDTAETTYLAMDGWDDGDPVSLTFAPFMYNTEDMKQAIVQGQNKLHVYKISAQLTPAEPFPVKLPDNGPTSLSMTDTDNNGTMELLFGGTDRIFVIAGNGSVYNHQQADLNFADTTAVKGTPFGFSTPTGNYMGTVLSHNRLVLYRQTNGNHWQMVDGYPQSLPLPVRSQPVIVAAADTCRLYLGADNGTILIRELESSLGQFTGQKWSGSYANMARTSWVNSSVTPPPPNNAGGLDKANCYVYPSPWRSGQSGPDITINLFTHGPGSSAKKASVHIYDVSGACVGKYNVNLYPEVNNELALPGQNFSAGVYWALINAGGQRLTLPFAVEK